ncbi:hypothetical protein BZL30_4483 [Mycobacterium kansasii]|uniref:Uncharacterized protein n=1 Tax=Mycobacterium kansasii TaxID=1768 RepID=A0A1V3X304_MYCKA|nr:hypothetical protein BZL30_4483 [Mycobacterium kansasii]
MTSRGREGRHFSEVIPAAACAHSSAYRIAATSRTATAAETSPPLGETANPPYVGSQA